MQEFFQDLWSNRILIVSLFSWFIAQLVKTLIVFFQEKKFRLERMVGSGGMPSCHSAFVCALTIQTGRFCGVDSPFFALAFVFASVVMYDAIGVRRAAGEHAKILNKMVFSFKDLQKLLTAPSDSIEAITAQEQLKELLGHTPLQVLCGALLGILIGALL